MKLPRNVVIPPDKLTFYLLVERRLNDKAKFLARAGFTQDNPVMLKQAIRDLIAQNEAVIDRQDEYGVFFP